MACMHRSLSAPPPPAALHSAATMQSSSEQHARTLSRHTLSCNSHMQAGVTATLDAVRQTIPCLPFIWGPGSAGTEKNTPTAAAANFPATRMCVSGKRERHTQERHKTTAKKEDSSQSAANSARCADECTQPSHLSSQLLTTTLTQSTDCHNATTLRVHAADTWRPCAAC